MAVTAALPERTDAIATSTGLDGLYLLLLPAPGTYTLRASLAAFAVVSREVVLGPENCRASADLEMVLQSRAPKPVEPAASADTTPPAAKAPSIDGPRRGGDAAGQGRRRRPDGSPAGAGRFRGLNLTADAAGEGLVEGVDAVSQALLPPGFSADAPTESVPLAGGERQVQTIDSLLFGDRLQWLEEAGGDTEALARRMAQAGFDGPPGGGMRFPGGGLGGGPGGFGPGGGARRGLRRFRPQQPAPGLRLLQRLRRAS